MPAEESALPFRLIMGKYLVKEVIIITAVNLNINDISTDCYIIILIFRYE